MRWPKKIIAEEIQSPIQAIAVIAVIALAIAAMALFIAIGGNDNAATE